MRLIKVMKIMNLRAPLWGCEGSPNKEMPHSLGTNIPRRTLNRLPFDVKLFTHLIGDNRSYADGHHNRGIC